MLIKCYCISNKQLIFHWESSKPNQKGWIVQPQDMKMVLTEFILSLSGLNHLHSSHWLSVALHTPCVVLSWQVFLHSLMLMRTDMEINTTALGLWLRTKVLTPEPTPLIHGSGEIPQHVLNHGICVLSKSFLKSQGTAAILGSPQGNYFQLCKYSSCLLLEWGQSEILKTVC